MNVKELPEKVAKFAAQYFSLKLGDVEVKTPYFRNVKRVRAELRSLSGKGTPFEITDETKIYSKLRGFELKGKNEEQIREFMQIQGLGIDCSGFVAHIYDTWLKSAGRGGVGRNIRFPSAGLYRRIIRTIRPIENISADLLTGDLNTTPIQLNAVEPGDMIRMKGLKRGDHLVVISRVEYNDSNIPVKIEYIHSSPNYGKNNGVRRGAISITDINSELKDQTWTETDENGQNWTHQELLQHYEDNGLRRPNFLKRRN